MIVPCGWPFVCGTCTIECGPYPRLQDAGIVDLCWNFGKLNYHEEIYPNFKKDSATKTCGLTKVATKNCKPELLFSMSMHSLEPAFSSCRLSFGSRLISDLFT